MEKKQWFIFKLITYFKTENKIEFDKSIKRLTQEADRNRLQDILQIRIHGNYKPDYNRPKLYTDFQLFDNEGEIISGGVKTNCPRPVDFGDDYEKWLNAIHLEHAKEEEEKNLEALKEQQRKDFFQNEIGKFVMNRMTTVN